MAPPNHAALLAGVRAGKPDYDAIWRAYHEQIVAAVRVRLGSADLAEEAVSTAWLEVIKKGLLGPTTNNIAAVVTTVAMRRAIDIARRDRRVDRSADVADRDDPSAADDLGRIDDRVAAAQVAAAAWDYRHIFNDKEQVVYQQRYIAGRSHAEIATMLGVTRERVTQIDGALIAKLRAKLRADAESRRTRREEGGENGRNEPRR